MKNVLVIVVTYNGMQWLDRCLGSVAQEADLYVWDNHSTDGSADFVATHYPQAMLTRSEQNVWFATPNNMGMRYAMRKGYKYVYLLNQDAWLFPGTLRTLVSAAEAHPDYAVLSPVQMTADFQQLDPLFAKVYRLSGEDDVCRLRRVMAAHWLVPVQAIREIGVFEEDLFPHWGQDDDWCNRARYHGMKIGVVSSAQAVHDRAYRRESKEKLIRRNYYNGSLVRLCDVNRPLLERFLFVCIFTLVKAIKYGSIQPFTYFQKLCHKLPRIRKHRRESR